MQFALKYLTSYFLKNVINQTASCCSFENDLRETLKQKWAELIIQTVTVSLHHAIFQGLKIAHFV